MRSLTDRPFAVIALTWRAVGGATRRAVRTSLRSSVERLCALGVDIAILADEELAVVDGRLAARPGIEGRLFYVLANGAETYSVGPGGPRLVERAHPAGRGEQHLHEAAEQARRQLADLGVHTRLVRGVRGRVVIDLHPGPVAPAADGRRRRLTLDDVLRAAGVEGLSGAVALAEKAARASGLSRPVITTDGRRLTIGLSDASQTCRWVVTNLVRDRGREAGSLLLIGRDLGHHDSVPGREAHLLVPELEGATVVSVGDDAAALQVVRLGGGPRAVLDLLEQQIESRELVARHGFPIPTDDPTWLFSVEGFDPFREREVETWLTVANGRVGTRGSLEEGSAASTPATFVAGVFGDGAGDPPVRQPVPAPDWLCLRLNVDGALLSLANGEIVEHRRTLDMRQGLVLREWRQRERGGRCVRVRTARFASLDDRSLMAERAEASLEDAAGQLVWEGCLGISHAGGAVVETAVESLEEPGFLALTRGRNGGAHGLAALTVPVTGSPVVRRVLQARDLIGGFVEPGEPASVDRLAVVHATRSRAPSAAAMRKAIAAAAQTGFDELLRRHREAWRQRWDVCDIVIDGDPGAQTTTRFAVYHMIASADPGSPGVSIGARGLSGMSYFCHVFWDTEIFVVPFFIYTWPEAARALLAYRYHLLPGAREKAKMLGHKGALFPWESADSGRETTPPYGYGPGGEKIPILSGIMEHHISADVAWAVWEYWMVTGDDAFMVEMGVELLMDTARFWASRASREEDDRYHIRLVVGPDEYHESVDDNAYTNVLARWNIRRALDALAWLDEAHPEAAERLRTRLDVGRGEVRAWRAVADGLVDGFDPTTGLYEQFAGFYGLADVDPSLLRPRPRPADLLLGREVTQASKVVKQADVVMLCHLLTDDIDQEIARRNYDYYEPITVHGSSLSPATHAAVAAQVGLAAQAMEVFGLACAVDLADNMGNAAHGLHLATMGGIWQAVVMGFGGVRRRGAKLAVNPRLPDEWRSLRFAVRFRASVVRIHCERESTAITVQEAPLPVLFAGRDLLLEPGEHRFWRLPDGSWRYSAGEGGTDS